MEQVPLADSPVVVYFSGLGMNLISTRTALARLGVSGGHLPVQSVGGQKRAGDRGESRPVPLQAQPAGQQRECMFPTTTTTPRWDSPRLLPAPRSAVYIRLLSVVVHLHR